MVLILLFCVLSTLATTSYSLSCIECKDATDVPCTGDADMCSADEVCMSKYTLTTIAGIPVSKLFMRGCANRVQCSLMGSVSVPNARMITSTTCCYTDRCSPPRPVLPPTISSRKNGVICKSCQSFNAFPCDSDTYIECVGNETKCISQVGKISGSPPTSVRGCATPTLCSVGHEEGSFGHVKISLDTSCTDGSAALHYCRFLLATTCAWLFKVLN